MATTVVSTGGGGQTGQAATGNKAVNGGRFDFDDGGTYCGGWEDGKAHGHGVCTGPKGQGEYSGSWHFGFEVSGIYTWPSGSTYEGQWQNGKRHGLGVEARGRWLYRGEWTQGFKGRYGVRQSTTSAAKYEGTWANGLQDGYGSETYADAGTFKGQWLRGLRHGYGVRTSAQFGQANISRPKPVANNRGSTTSLRSDGAAGDPLADRDRKVDDGRGGFVLRARSDELPKRRGSLVEKSNIKNVFKGLKMRRQRSTGDIQTGRASGSIRSTGSSASWMSTDSGQSAYTVGDVPDEGSNASFVVEVGLDEQLDASVVETYMGEWKNDKRSGFGVSERSDGLKYEGEWYNNKKYGYGVTTFKDGTKEEGKYKNNVLITSSKKKHVFLIRSAKFRERIEAAVAAAQRAAKIAMQKEDIAISRTATARGKAEQADISGGHAREDSDVARIYAKQFAPDFHQPGEDVKCVDSIRAQLAARGGQTDNRKQPKAVSKGMDNYLSNSQAGGIGGDSLSPPPGGGATYTNYGLGGDPGGSRRVSVNHGEDHLMGNAVDNRSRTPMRASAKGRGAQDAPSLSSNIMNDRFDHYNRPPSRAPSRDRSVDRFASRGTTPVPDSLINPRTRAPSVQRSTAAQDWTPDSGVYEDEIGAVPNVGSRRPSRPPSVSGEAPPLTGNGSVGGGFVPYTIPQTQTEAESLLRNRVCGQQITPVYPVAAPGQGSVKRTESLYINPVVRHQAQVKPVESSTDLKSESIPVSDAVTETVIERDTVTENATVTETETKTTDFKDIRTETVKATGTIDEAEKILNVVPLGTVSFIGPFNKVVTSEIQLTNTTDKRVCFKVKTTAPHRYYVRPKNGIIDPYETVTVAVMLQPFDDEPQGSNKDKFMIQSLYAPDGKLNLANIFRMAEQTGYYYSKLFCEFKMPENDIVPEPQELLSPSKNVRFSPTTQHILDQEESNTLPEVLSENTGEDIATPNMEEEPIENPEDIVEQEIIEENVEEHASEIDPLELQSNLIQEEALFLQFSNNAVESEDLTEASADQYEDDQVDQLQSQISQLTTECTTDPNNETATAAPVLKRKKSLPDSEALPLATSKLMSREEVSVLSSAQRNEFRRQAEEADLYRANPLLYITSPTVQDWFSRQRLVMLILFLNLSLALMFFKLLS